MWKASWSLLRPVAHLHIGLFPNLVPLTLAPLPLPTPLLAIPSKVYTSYAKHSSVILGTGYSLCSVFFWACSSAHTMLPYSTLPEQFVWLLYNRPFALLLFKEESSQAITHPALQVNIPKVGLLLEKEDPIDPHPRKRVSSGTQEEKKKDLGLWPNSTNYRELSGKQHHELLSHLCHDIPGILL